MSIETREPGKSGSNPERDIARQRRVADVSNPLDKARAHRLLAVVKKEAVMTPTKEPSTIVHVWPHLLMIEFLCAMVFTISLFITSAFINAPLEELANGEVTPNPAKAPWYFLNLQEILLHMDTALAGIIVPGVALGMIALIPYVDLGPGQMGRWFTSQRGKAVNLFAIVFTTVVTIFLIIFDAIFPVKTFVKNFAGGALTQIKLPVPLTDQASELPLWTTMTPLDIVLSNWIIPLTTLIGLPILLAWIVRKRYKADTRDVIQALFTGFVVVFVITTIASTTFRGPGLTLGWPWTLEPRH